MGHSLPLIYACYHMHKLVDFGLPFATPFLLGLNYDLYMYICDGDAIAIALSLSLPWLGLHAILSLQSNELTFIF